MAPRVAEHGDSRAYWMLWLSAAFRQESKEKNKRKAEQAKKRKAEEAERQQAHEGPDFPAADPTPTEPATSDYSKAPLTRTLFAAQGSASRLLHAVGVSVHVWSCSDQAGSDLPGFCQPRSTVYQLGLCMAFAATVPISSLGL